MAIETIMTLVPRAVDTPRGAVWAATAAAWIGHLVRDLARWSKPRLISAFAYLGRLRTQWAVGGRCIDLR